MATIESRGYANKVTHGEGGGKAYVKFDLACKQKRKINGVLTEEKIYLRCIDFTSSSDAPVEGEYIGVTGYLTVFANLGKDGKAYANVDVSVKSYEKVAQLAPRDGSTRAGVAGNAGGAGASADAPPPSDPFALKPDADLGK